MPKRPPRGDCHGGSHDGAKDAKTSNLRAHENETFERHSAWTHPAQ